MPVLLPSKVFSRNGMMDGRFVNNIDIQFEIGEITNDDNTTTNCVFSNKSHPVMATQSVILGASNCTRLVFENPNVHNISVSGTTLDQVQKLLDKSDSQVDSVVLSLGTNDVTQYRNDTEQIIVTPLGSFNL
jgi:hypothetical protein